jgi:hypothetical protein
LRASNHTLPFTTTMMKVSMLASALALVSSALITPAASEYYVSVEASAVDVGETERVRDMEHEQEPRELRYQYAKNKIHWPECVIDKLTVAQCKQLIEEELEQGHVLSNVKIGLKYPEMQFLGDFQVRIAGVDEIGPAKDYYYRVAIPVNYMAQAHGYFVDGQMTFNKEWDGIGSGPRGIGPWTCRGQDANQCCRAIKRTVRDRDSSHNYVDCWVQEQAPIPFHKANRIAYCAWEWDKVTETYVAMEVAEWRQEKVMNHAKAKLLGTIVPMVEQCILDLECSYNKLGVMANNLHFHGRSVPALQHAATDIDAYLHRPNTPETIFTLDAKLEELMERVAVELENFISAPFEVAHNIIIHAGDPAGSFVRHEPKIGTAPGVPECIPS